jgi:hypothetical protein
MGGRGGDMAPRMPQRCHNDVCVRQTRKAPSGPAQAGDLKIALVQAEACLLRLTERGA